MAGNIWTWGIDYRGQPLLDAWWSPGWTAQNKDYPQVPQSSFATLGFPQNLVYVTVTGNYFDTVANPMSGYLTFWPSSALTFTVSGQTTYMPQRYSGTNQTLLGINQMSDSKIYLWYGQLQVSLLATDNANMTPVSFSYHVKEKMYGGRQYDILVPSADASTAIDINTLIIPGSIYGVNEEIPQTLEDLPTISIPYVSSQYLAADVTTSLTFDPTTYPVNFAFMSGPTEPQAADWHTGAWASSSAPFIADIMVGPNGLVLATGTYKVWIEVVAGSQNPVFPAGYLTIY